MNNWREAAACRKEDPELFFPIGLTGPGAMQAEAAKAVCRRCPVVRECLEWALDAQMESGVCGGTTEQERRALRRHRPYRTGRRLDEPA